MLYRDKNGEDKNETDVSQSYFNCNEMVVASVLLYSHNV